MPKSQFVYITYIRATQKKVWSALTNPEFIRQYWFGINVKTDWKVGSSWQLVFGDGTVADTGEILECDPPKRLVIKWRNEFRPELKAEGWSRCTMELERQEGVTKLTVTHTIPRANAKFIGAVSGGWPMVLSNLKSLLETGAIAMKTKVKP